MVESDMSIGNYQLLREYITKPIGMRTIDVHYAFEHTIYRKKSCKTRKLLFYFRLVKMPNPRFLFFAVRRCPRKKKLFRLKTAKENTERTSYINGILIIARHLLFLYLDACTLANKGARMAVCST
jgi:hypothetical protein